MELNSSKHDFLVREMASGLFALLSVSLTGAVIFGWMDAGFLKDFLVSLLALATFTFACTVSSILNEGNHRQFEINVVFLYMITASVVVMYGPKFFSDDRTMVRYFFLQAMIAGAMVYISAQKHRQEA